MGRFAQGITHRRVLNIALPILVSNATIPILGAVDTAVVGQLGAAAPIGAVGIGALILTAIYWLFGFLRMGTAGLTAQALGAGEPGEMRALLMRALLIGVGAGVLLVLVQGPLFALSLAVTPASDTVEDLARGYLAIRIWSAPAAIAIYGITGWLVALERTRAVLAVQLWMNGLNIALDLWFVLGLGWGVNGVAFATFLAEWSGLALGLWFCRDALGAGRNWARITDRARIARMMAVNGDLFFRSLFIQIMIVSFLFLGARFDDVTLAANQILMQFLFITSYALDGFAYAAQSLVGQAVGAQAPEGLRRAVRLTALWSLGFALALMLGFGLGGEALIALMTTAQPVREMAAQYLIYMVIGPLLSVPAWLLDGVFTGATRTRDMRNMMGLSLLIYGAFVLALVPLLGNHGLWVAFVISFAARGATLATRYPALRRSVAG